MEDVMMSGTGSLQTAERIAPMPGEHGPDCPVAGLLEVLTRPWMLHILWSLSRQGPMRFGVLRRRVHGISARLLTVRLRSLEGLGFVRRTVVPGKVTEVLYSPTQRLADMNEFMRQLDSMNAKWVEEGHTTVS
jgi:DNA-binding HxlR family transcriptional regulator